MGGGTAGVAEAAMDHTDNADSASAGSWQFEEAPEADVVLQSVNGEHSEERNALQFPRVEMPALEDPEDGEVQAEEAPQEEQLEEEKAESPRVKMPALEEPLEGGRPAGGAAGPGVQQGGRHFSWGKLVFALLAVCLAGALRHVPFSRMLNNAELDTVVLAPPFDKAVDITVQWAGVLSEVFENDTLPSPMTLARQRVLLEEASINVRTLTFAESGVLADHLEASAAVSQQASDDLVDMYVAAQSGVQLVVSYMVILDRRLSDNRTAGNATWLAAEFESFVKGTDDSLVESIEKADRAWTSLADFHQQLSVASRVGRTVYAPLKRDLTVLQKEQESSWWRWEKTSDLFLGEETGALESILSDMSKFRQDIGDIRVLLRGHREHLHNIRNAFFYSARESVPIEGQLATLKWGLGAIKESQANILDNKRRKLTGV